MKGQITAVAMCRVTLSVYQPQGPFRLINPLCHVPWEELVWRGQEVGWGRVQCGGMGQDKGVILKASDFISHAFKE